MGIEQFFSSIESNNITNLESSFTKKLEKKIITDNLYIDFNSIIYIVSQKIVNDLNYILYNLIINSSNIDSRLLEEYIKEENMNFEKFKKYFTEDKVNNLIMQKIVEYLTNIFTNYVEPTKLELIYIGIDGVPTKSKIIEQKKRRFMGGLMNKIKGKLFLKYENELKNNKNRYVYEQMKFNWNRNQISPGTEFMDKLNDILSNIEKYIILKNICPKLKSFTFSGIYEPGEGEKKIVDHIRNYIEFDKSYLIYSPDSDMTLLGLLLNTRFSYDNPKFVNNLKILRHNQQKDNYDIVYIDILSENLYNYVIKKLYIDSLPNKDNIINDIVFILTIFGNDFLPKIESFSVRQDFNRIIDKYINVLNKTYTDKYHYLISYSKTNSKKMIDQYILIKIFYTLQIDEGGNLQKKYMDQHYSNYNKLKKIFDADQNNFTEKLNLFLTKLRNFNNAISNNNKIYEWSSETDFLDKMRKITKFENANPKNMNNKQFIKAYFDFYIEKKKFPQMEIIFRRYNRSLMDKHNYNSLRKSLDNLDPKLDVTKYDEELFSFENMLDEYTKRLNAYSLNLGFIKIDPLTYTWKTEKIEKGVKRFYKEFFQIDEISIDNQRMKYLVQNYIEGLMWIFEYYFNNFNIDQNKQISDAWFYQYNYAPLLKQIYELLKKNQQDDNYLKNIIYNLLKYKINMEDYFNTLEHFMYVSPTPLMLELVPNEYINFVQNSDYYPDFDKISDSLIYNHNDLKLIDCRGALFLTKCHFNINQLDLDEDLQFIRTLRKIKLSKNTKKLTGSN